MASAEFDVCIIGYGPVGAGLANLLGLSGIKTVVLEREPSVYHLPRAVALDGEGMRLIQTMGLADELLPRLNVSRNIRHVSADGKLLLLLTRSGVGPEGWNNAYRFYQPEFEAVLRHGVSRHPSVDVRLRCEAFALDKAGDHVRVRYENLAAGALGELNARYVVGCDGARSTVRRFMGAALQDLRSHERWIVLDMILEQPPSGVPEAADETGRVIDAIQYCDPARPTTFIPMPGKRHRWEFMLMPQDDPVAITNPDRIYELLKPWGIDPAKSTIERAVVYTFHSALSTQWRHGRLILAGDSAHQMPPFLGQGMCSGLRDIANLGWKLRDVIGGVASDSLLDTYETERMEHVRAFIDLAVELGSVIQTTDPEKARERDRDLIANPTTLRPITPRLGPGLHGNAPPPAAGRAAQPRLADGKLLDDHVGYRYAVLAYRSLVDALPATMRSRLENDIVLIVAEGEAAAYLADLHTGAVVIRPDRHILGVASTPAELDAVLACRRWRAQPDDISRRTPKTAGAVKVRETFVVTASRVPSNSVDHVGSLKRPPELVAAWREWEAGKLAPEKLQEVQDRSIRFAIKMQEDLGLPIVTDGEFRRGGWSRGFLNAVEGFDFRASKLVFRNDDGFSTVSPAPVATKKVRRAKPIVTEDFEFIKSVATRQVKVTMPTPSHMHFGHFKNAVDPVVYPHVEAYWDDMVAVFQQEIKELYAAGCRYLQLDEVPLALLCDENIRALAKSEGDDPDKLVGLYIDVLNRAVAGRPADLAIAMHLCRGNMEGLWMGDGGYAPIAEALLTRADVDAFLLEYDSRRAGDFAPLRYLPAAKRAYLGIISTKNPALESPDDLMRRLEEAAQHAPMERLGICPQCGFSSAAMSKFAVLPSAVTTDIQTLKIELLVDIGRRVWGHV